MTIAHPSGSPLLASTPPDVSESMAAEIAAAHYGLHVRARKLTSERDTNFQVIDRSGGLFVLKITNSAEPRKLTNLQTGALLHIQTVDPDLPVPRIIPANDGNLEIPLRVGNETCIVRLLTYLEGKPLYQLPATQERLTNVGICLARLGLALRDFVHTAGDHDLLWDIRNVARLRGLTSFIADRPRRDLVERFLDRYDAEIGPQLAVLRSQIVHNDFNPHNVLMDPVGEVRVSGIIDFGDVVHTQLVNDIAVAASYHVHTEEPLSGIAQLVHAYHGVRPLLPHEIELLFDLITARLVTTVTITHWRAANYPANREYILRNNPRAWLGIERFAAIAPWHARQVLAAACGME